MVKKAIFKSSIFFIILVFMVSTLNSVFIVKSGQRDKLIQGLYDNTGDAFDVVLLGSSHMNSSINPNLLWNQYGITSFNYGTGGQPIDVTYYLLKEILKTHDNPIVVVDLYYLGLTDEFGQEGYIRNVLDNMKFSKNKIEAIMNCTPKEEWAGYFLPMLKYHDRWKELTEDDFKNDPSSSYYAKGFGAEIEMYGKDNMTKDLSTEVGEIPPKSEEYLYKIINLSKEKGFKLVFINAPYDYTSTTDLKEWYKEPDKMFNKAAEIAKENNIPFVNYCNRLGEIGFDFKSDMYNIGHENIFGSNKVTEEFGKFLKKNYELVDHRNDMKYESWNSDYSLYLEAEANAELVTKEKIEDYMSLLENDNYIVTVSCNNCNNIKSTIDLEQSLSKIGLNFEKYNNNSNYLAIVDSNNVEKEIWGNSKLLAEMNFQNNIELKVTTSSNDKNIPSTIFNGKEITDKYNGLNIVVYDKLFNCVVDNISLDQENEIKR